MPQKIFILITVFLIVSSTKILVEKTKIPSPAENTIVPIVNKIPKEFNRGPSDKSKIALTFDADITAAMKRKLTKHQVESWYNKEVIKILEENQVKATLFLTGMWVETYPDEAQKLAQNPLFEIGSHSYSHPGFTRPCYLLRPISQKEKETEIDKTQTILKSIGIDNKLFRFPGGCHNQTDSYLVNSRGLSVVNWDVASGDAFNRNTNAIIKRVITQTKNGSIIVFHMHGGPNAPQTAPALKQIIPKLKERGYEFVKVSELF